MAESIDFQAIVDKEKYTSGELDNDDNEDEASSLTIFFEADENPLNYYPFNNVTRCADSALEDDFSGLELLNQNENVEIISYCLGSEDKAEVDDSKYADKKLKILKKTLEIPHGLDSQN